ncbi:hypothetical protein ISN44_As11g029960 [Arabidopsis suecica]|uniref:Arabidopsis retrotransposon Orf1 C-terminal domain-containing protein n=1 Tax=Arabidopsis suecica TaxID=45249 RepID=A0A8T1ZCT4_ARASU|nr:hypothetical protein ISN44_As11g029960 [Arabidopsis suecica]
MRSSTHAELEPRPNKEIFQRPGRNHRRALMITSAPSSTEAKETTPFDYLIIRNFSSILDCTVCCAVEYSCYIFFTDDVYDERRSKSDVIMESTKDLDLDKELVAEEELEAEQQLEPAEHFEPENELVVEKGCHDKARGKGKEKHVEAGSTTSTEAHDEYHEEDDNFMPTSLFVGQTMKDDVDYRESINKIKLTPTLLIDYSICKALDLDDDVVWMMDVRRRDKAISCHGSLAFPSTSSPLARDGILYFTINGEHYTISIPRLGRALGFDYQDAIDFGPEEHGDIWQRIGRGPFTSGKTKSAMISHPAIRCIHKLLANTIFARTAQNSILGDELLIKHDAIYCTDDQASLSFGGVIKTILEAAGVDLTDRAFTAEQHYMDLEMKILEGACINPDRFGYRYHVPPRLIRTIMLPCPTIPCLRDGATRWDPDSSEFL